MTARFARLIGTALVAMCVPMTLVAGGTLPATATTAAATGTGKITGTVSDPNGYPLSGITIRLYDDGPDDGRLVGTTTTDDAGRYRFVTVRTDGDDLYRLVATDDTGAHVYKYSNSFPVAAGTTTTSNLTMQIAGLIQGKVSTKDGAAPSKPARRPRSGRRCSIIRPACSAAR